MRVQVGRGMRGIRGVVGGRSARSRPCRGEARITSCSAQHPLSCCQSIFPYYCSPLAGFLPLLLLLVFASPPPLCPLFIYPLPSPLSRRALPSSVHDNDILLTFSCPGRRELT